jgi:hypothetical protein
MVWIKPHNEEEIVNKEAMESAPVGGNAELMGFCIP